MALIKCSECETEMSDKAKFCPKCGAENKIMFCPECGKQLSKKAIMCPKCGYAFENAYNQSEMGSAYGFGVASVCLAILSLFFSFFIIHICAFTFGAVAFFSNSGRKNRAKRLGDIGMALSIISTLIYFLMVNSMSR